MSQELTDAEWLKELAEWFRRYGALEGVDADQAERDVDRLRSIADRLERPGVLNREARLQYNPSTFTGTVSVMIEGMPFSMATGVEPVDGLPVKVSVTPAAT